MRRLTAIALVLAACSSAPAAPAASRQPQAAPTIGPYQQTWTKSYGSTTCSDWIDLMNDHEQFVAAGDMLFAAWKGDGVDRLPPDATIRIMQSAITESCRGPGEEAGIKIAEAAAFLYLTADDLKP